ncbi:MAG TPA: ABC transporter permease [Gemmatimonadaceae bacterium]|nr:ABC transporter permease [Gemmatimonadaceae bacterium]
MSGIVDWENPWMRTSPLDALWYDLRHALRALRRSPGFTLLAAGTLALGIGANAALFTIADRLLLRAPAGVRDPDGVVRLYTVERNSAGPSNAFWRTGYAQYAELQREHGAFSSVAAYDGPFTTTVAASDGSLIGHAQLEAVTPSFFRLLGVRPALGRFLTPDDNRPPDGAPVVVLSYALWQERFGGDPRVLGRAVWLDDVGTYGRSHVPRGV